MPRYLLFLWQEYPNGGGWENDWHGVFDSVEEAKAEATKYNHFNHGEIVDMDSLRYVKMMTACNEITPSFKFNHIWTNGGTRK